MKPFCISKKDLLVVAAFWGFLTGLGEGICAYLSHSWIAADLLRSALIIEPLIFVAIPFVVRMAQPKFTPDSDVLSKATLICCWLTLFAWARTFKPQWQLEVTILALAVVASLVAFAFLRQMERWLWFQRRSIPVMLVVVILCAVMIPIKEHRHEQREMARLPEAPVDAPNILLVVVDTLRADHLSLYGYQRPTSPNLQKLAAQSTVFENAIAPSSWTLPSHVSLLTGRYPHEHHVDQDYSYFGFDYPTIGDILRKQGYRTAAFSANGLLFSRERGFGHAFLHFEDDFQSAGSVFMRTYYGHKLDELIYHLGIYRDVMGRRRAEDINRQALRWVDKSKRPFFVVLNYFDTHDPYLPPEPYLHQYSNKKNPGKYSSRSWVADLSPEQVQDTMDAYDGAIQYVDAQIGQLLKDLDARGLSHDTLLVVTSDHGEAFNEHGFMDHGNALYSGLVRVPLIFRQLGKVPAGMRISAPVSLTEIPATLLEVAGFSANPSFRGPSLASLWTNPSAAEDVPPPLSELAQLNWNKRFPNYDGPMAAVTTSEWRYIGGGRFHEELFHEADDPGEHVNLAGSIAGTQAEAVLSDQLADASRACAENIHPRGLSNNFVAGLSETVVMHESPSAVAVADLNGDGNPDLAVASETNKTVSVLLANSRGQFEAAVGSPYRTASTPRHLSIRDVNRDRQPDLEFWDDKEDHATVLLGDGTGTFASTIQSAAAPMTQARKPLLLPTSGRNETKAPSPPDISAIESHPASAFSRNTARGDVNGDGIMDVAMADAEKLTVTVLIGTRSGGFIRSTIHLANSPESLALIDVNHDGRADLVLSDPRRQKLTILLSH